jgi:hypothetical protein
MPLRNSFAFVSMPSSPLTKVTSQRRSLQPSLRSARPRKASACPCPPKPVNIGVPSSFLSSTKKKRKSVSGSAVLDVGAKIMSAHSTFHLQHCQLHLRPCETCMGCSRRSSFARPDGRETGEGCLVEGISREQEGLRSSAVCLEAGDALAQGNLPDRSGNVEGVVRI